jgi:hypothetical protein
MPLKKTALVIVALKVKLMKLDYLIKEKPHPLSG